MASIFWLTYALQCVPHVVLNTTLRPSPPSRLVQALYRAPIPYITSALEIVFLEILRHEVFSSLKSWSPRGKPININRVKRWSTSLVTLASFVSLAREVLSKERNRSVLSGLTSSRKWVEKKGKRKPSSSPDFLFCLVNPFRAGLGLDWTPLHYFSKIKEKLAVSHDSIFMFSIFFINFSVLEIW